MAAQTETYFEFTERLSLKHRDHYLRVLKERGAQEAGSILVTNLQQALAKLKDAAQIADLVPLQEGIEQAAALFASRRMPQGPYVLDRFLNQPAIQSLVRGLRMIHNSAPPEMLEGQKEMMGGSINASITLQMSLLYHKACHDHAGRRVYELSPGLAQRLKHTELKGLHAADLELPYKSIYILIPKNSGLEIWNADTGNHRAEGVFVTEDPIGKDQNNPTRTWRLHFIGENKDPDISPLYHANYHFRVPLEPPTANLDDILRSEFDEIRGQKIIPQLSRDGYEKMFYPLFSFVLNTICYATFPDAVAEEFLANEAARNLWAKSEQEPEGSLKREALRAKVRAMNPPRRTYLGRGVEPWTDAEQGKGGGAGHPVTLRTLVQGHWRNQAYGERHSLRRRQWIQPFWRGPQGDAEEPKRHVLT